MARFDTTGMQDLINEMQQMGQNGGDVARVMTLAAADEIAQSWRESIREHGFVKTGAMLDSVGFPKGAQQMGGMYYADIYPQGKDSTGTRNAEKAFILNYGSSRLKPTYWTDEADARAETKVTERLSAIWGDFLETGIVPPAPVIPARGKKQSGVRTERKK